MVRNRFACTMGDNYLDALLKDLRRELQVRLGMEHGDDWDQLNRLELSVNDIRRFYGYEE